jgi:hypothetical protein
MPTEAELREKVAELATRLDVPGVAVGVAMVKRCTSRSTA